MTERDREESPTVDGANRYGYGLHAPELEDCPNCGTKTVARRTSTPNLCYRYRRCFECRSLLDGLKWTLAEILTPVLRERNQE